LKLAVGDSRKAKRDKARFAKPKSRENLDAKTPRFKKQNRCVKGIDYEEDVGVCGVDVFGGGGDGAYSGGTEPAEFFEHCVFNDRCPRCKGFQVCLAWIPIYWRGRWGFPRSC
jgi:hypothetical protein